MAGMHESGQPNSMSAFPCWPTSVAPLPGPLGGARRTSPAMAIALMNSPALLLLDEPTAGLSPRAAEELFGTIIALNQSGVGILMVEQNALEGLAGSAGRVCPRVCAGARPRRARGPSGRVGRRSDRPRSLSRRQGAAYARTDW